MPAIAVKNVNYLKKYRFSNYVYKYFIYLGSSQGLQAIIGSIIIIITFIASYIINLDRSGDQWSFRKSTVEHYQT
jgi:hypothetical protein